MASSNCQDPVATKEHCRYALETIWAATEENEGGKSKCQCPFENAPQPSFPTNIETPFFVTLKKGSPRSKSKDEADLPLRGCIGTTSPAPHKDIGEYALKSAFHDRRFDPLSSEELPDIVCSVSLLVNYEEAKNWCDWTVGTHGIIIDFDTSGRNYHAIYLPEVASEQGWDQREAVGQLVRKAGYKGKINSELLDAIKLTRFQSTKAHMSFSELYQLYQLN